MKNSKTREAHAKRMIQAQMFIHKHLDEDLTLHRVANVVGVSPYHFHRVFYAFTGESLNCYIRRLRLERAASLLKDTQQPVTDIALDSGYQTPASFSRAFRKVIGISPKNYRSQIHSEIKNYPIQQKESIMKPKIVHLKTLPIVFVRKEGSYEYSAKEAWKELLLFATKNYPNWMNAQKFGMGLDDPNITKEENLRFDACLSDSEKITISGNVRRRQLEGGKCAQFLHRGPYRKLEETFKAIFRDWYPMHHGELRDHPCICEYLNMELMDHDPAALLTNIYVPLK